MSTFGDNLRKIRKEKNMTQDEFATLLGTSKQVVSRYENGQRSPKVSIVSEYADKLGIPIAMLTNDLGSQLLNTFDPVFGSNSPAAKKLRAIGEQLAVPSLSDPDESELIDIYRSLNVTGRQTLLGTARGLAANPDMKENGTSKNGTA